jgi:hypothetical protein
MKVSQSPDMIISCSLFSLYLSVLPIAAALRTFEKTNETFDDMRWMLTITRVACECRDRAGLAHLCRGTSLMRILTKAKEGYMKRGTRDGSSLADLCSTHQVALHRLFHGIVLVEIKGHALSTESWVCWLAFLVAQPHRVDQRG